ncbi:LPS assembly lipoprotein LptE [Aliarcobacter butzleri]|uniref:LPS assembly lipoprotein LptE n=1 Tax=Aliarcobacter butzleri TaxID=28197 RepID=A0AAW7PNN3_9BACT|nr:LPS assembly lipoprotein LptE [Aliarcobacter butzleri]MCG3715670.1 LPS assembly lipoprotein LptE [Aliarcobacter butzleri]MCT7536787.1 LPS assembly lipoprotein LptE [Aliarcobacter butzleri]MCT7554025.1 LPS assembly lipoprotein LptE [Aliarcobacter butzleri]MCT7576920.1 LPS assembly lipoprotein LptE [Aliarcobacter butzleri]MCT7591795.1 LPS assembly lipoprotein LptE [Aliarcobacter butzleri]
MFHTKKVLLTIFSVSLAFLFVACGYKPSTYYAKKEMEGNVYVKLDVSLVDPRNSVLVKDAVTKILIQKLDSNLVDKEKDADVVMNLGISSVNLSALQYDAKGYNKLYKAQVFIRVDYYRKENGIKKSFTVDGEYDFAVDIGGTITDANRYDAITKASDQAVSEIVSRIAVQSFK